MKNIKNRMLLKLYFLASISILLFASCSDDSGDSAGKLAVTGISRSVIDDPLVEGDRQVDVPTDIINAGNYYIIRGSGFATLKSISFNGMESYFNPTMVTDNAIVVLVDQKTPYYNEMDEMKIVTNIGTLNYKVAIRPPSPNIKGFPINPNPGDIITITGEYFLHPVVNFGDTAVEPISSTLTEIKVQVPNNIQYKSLSITNVSGTTVAGQSLGSAIYDDAYTSLMSYNGLWRPATNHYDIAYDKDSSQGTKCINWTSGPDWDGLYIGIDKSKVDLSKYKAIRISIKGEKAGSVSAIINGNWGATYPLKFGTSWTYLEIPISSVGSPTELTEVTFQETGGFGGNNLFIDDIGLVLK
ncbi:IPT/TIG domain-containing protein [Flavobacterium sp. SH_e]|uniref:IPT/TIG domain-containing protein n=1 Tax=Flavobacterium TaxID=237 RepID=UPI0021E4A00B|nr:IPT/TIG domain-containing protein [Flavobacterium sp. SH_e]MCV2483735.1 IPT/TIG domain-containing protein [Flavobacterium sp. SH_e]